MNVDDTYADYWRGLLGRRRCLGFGLASGAEITAVDVVAGADGQRFRLISPWGGAQVNLPFPGEHNLRNAP